MKVSFLFAFIWSALLASAGAQSVVSISNYPIGRYLADSSGAVLNDGSLVMLGTFDNVTEDDWSAISLLPVNELAAAAGWTFFGDTSSDSIMGYHGKLKGDVVNNTTDAASFGGKQIFIWVFNAPTIEGSTQYGIYTAWGGDPLWTFAQGIPENQAEIFIDDANLIALLGNINGDALQLVAMPEIPEPAAYAALLGLGALAVVVARRGNRTVKA